MSTYASTNFIFGISFIFTEKLLYTIVQHAKITVLLSFLQRHMSASKNIIQKTENYLQLPTTISIQYIEHAKIKPSILHIQKRHTQAY